MNETKLKWIEAGYLQFAFAGPESIHIEKLAKDIGLNKSGFYHYFIDRDTFFIDLIEHHYLVNERFCNEIMISKKFDPDFINLVMKYKTAVFVQKHMRMCTDNTMFREAFKKVSDKNEKAILPLWIDYMKIPDNRLLATEFWGMFRDVFFICTSAENLSLELIRTLLYRFSSVLNVLRRCSCLPDKNAKSD